MDNGYLSPPGNIVAFCALVTNKCCPNSQYRRSILQGGPKMAPFLRLNFTKY